MRRISPLPGFDPRSVQPVASRYTHYSIPAHSLLLLPVVGNTRRNFIYNSNIVISDKIENKLNLINYGNSSGKTVNFFCPEIKTARSDKFLYCFISSGLTQKYFKPNLTGQPVLGTFLHTSSEIQPITP